MQRPINVLLPRTIRCSNMATRSLRVAIFPYIPHLARDNLEGLRQYIVSEFRKEYGVTIQVDSSIDPYNLKQMTSTHLGTPGKQAYDVMEFDTILFGELVKSNQLQPLDDYFKVMKDEYAASTQCTQWITLRSCMVSQLCSVPIF